MNIRRLGPGLRHLLERLEARLLLVTLTVNTNSNANSRDGQLSLRQAILLEFAARCARIVQLNRAREAAVCREK